MEKWNMGSGSWSVWRVGQFRGACKRVKQERGVHRHLEKKMQNDIEPLN